MIESQNNIERASDIAYRKIREAIVSGKFQYGKKLSKRAMAEYCGVSIIPVIEALNRLESKGLVESNPYYGSRVIEINEQRIDDSNLLREAIETQIVRVLCFTLGIDEINVLKTMAINLDKMVRKEHSDDSFYESHYAFHYKLAELTRSNSMVETLNKIHLFEMLVNSEESYKELTQYTMMYSHLDIIEAIAQRNPEEASYAMRHHIYRSQATKTPIWVKN